jgi:hypothetical protein
LRFSVVLAELCLGCFVAGIRYVKEMKVIRVAVEQELLE